MAKLNMGFIRAGFIGPVHADSIAILRDIAVPYAVAEDDEEKHEGLEAEGLKVFPSADAMIADPDVHTVHITGPDQYHAQWAIKAMDAGKKVVVCEKPMTTTLEDSVKVVERAEKFEQDGGVFMVNINYMGHALPRAAREYRLQGHVGEIAIVKAVYEQDWLMDPNVWNWRVEGPMCASKDILPHLISAGMFMGGVFPVRLTADLQTIVEERQKPAGRVDALGAGGASEGETVPTKVTSDLYSSVLCDLNNGGSGNFMVTQYLSGRHNWWEITLGGKRRLTWNQTQPNVMEIGQSGVSGGVFIPDPQTLVDLISGMKVSGESLEPKEVLKQASELLSQRLGEIGPSPQTLANLFLINNPGYLEAMGFLDAKEYSPYPGEHPAGHIDAFARNFRTGYLVALGKLDREQAVYPGAIIGHGCVAVADAVLKSKNSNRSWVDVDYKGLDAALAAGKI